MQAYNMHRFTVVAPHVRNDGTPAPYARALRLGLLAEGITGWTEYETVGSWRGKREPGTTFELYIPAAYPHGGTVAFEADEYTLPAFASVLGAIARRAMPDQEAIQVTVDPVPTALYEA